jgi:formamidase
MAEHHLAPPVRRPLADAPDTGHNRWHPDLEPAIVVQPGDEILVDCRDGLDGQVLPTSTDADLLEMDLTRPHPMTGPIYVEGAEPGDVLRVEILDVRTDTFGSTPIIPGFGLLADRFPDPYLVTWGLHDGVATSGRMPGIRIPGDPFVGVIGVAPSHERMAEWTRREAAVDALSPLAEGAAPAIEPYASTGVRTIPPRELGGNLDVMQVRAGSTVFLPVDVPGALLSLGDVHFSQGDGEVCGTAIECHGQVRIRVEPLREVAHRPLTPLIESTEPAFRARRHICTTGLPIDADGGVQPLDTTLAARNALEAMIRWLVDETGLTREQAYVLCSATVDLRISEIVDVPHPVVTALCPLDIFHELRPQRG